MTDLRTEVNALFVVNQVLDASPNLQAVTATATATVIATVTVTVTATLTLCPWP